MIAKEAHILLIRKFPHLTAVKCYEYPTMFVFNSIPEASRGMVNSNRVFDSLTSVNKKTGEIRNFKPYQISIEEYEKGREIKNFT